MQIAREAERLNPRVDQETKKRLDEILFGFLGQRLTSSPVASC